MPPQMQGGGGGGGGGYVGYEGYSLSYSIMTFPETATIVYQFYPSYPTSIVTTGTSPTYNVASQYTSLPSTTAQYPTWITSTASSSSSSPSSSVPPFVPPVASSSNPGQFVDGTGPMPSSSTTSTNGSSFNVGAVVGTIGAVVFTVTAAIIALCCIRRRRVRRRRRQKEEEDLARPSMTSSSQQPTRAVTRDELFDVVPLPPPLARYSRVVPPDQALHPPPPAWRLERASTITSSWADDSEIDALATDGSTIARTISTRSVSSRLSDTTVTSSRENPFDHPAYTLMSSSRRTPTTNGPRSAGLTPTDTISTSNPFLDGATFNADASSPISPVSPAQTNATSTFHLNTFFGSPGEADLERGTTFIHHIDAGRAQPQRAAQPEPERIGDGEVHIPPTYMALYPGPNGSR